MKYGLIVYFRTDNIGDDIQSFAMEKFLPRVDYLIEREHLDSFYTETGEKVATFLGGWYLHKVLNWPPSPFLKILPISFHLKTEREGENNLVALVHYGGEWLKKFPAIGCRDESTVNLLEHFGIAAYLTGCFTLTLKPFQNVIHHGKIVLTDLSEEVAGFVKERVKGECVIVSHYYGEYGEKEQLPQEVITFAKEHDRRDVIPTSHYPARRCRKSWSSRRALVEGLLRFYQGASLVVTSRLHAALPCLALGTPVLLVNNKLADDRFYTFVPYLNHATPEELLSGKYRFNFNEPKEPPGGHEKFAEKIRSESTNFINSCEQDDDNSLIDVETWLDGQKRNSRLKRIMRVFLSNSRLFNMKSV